MSWKNTKCRPSAVAQTGDSYTINAMAKAARVLLKGMGLRENVVGLTEHKLFGETFNDECSWSRATRLHEFLVKSGPSYLEMIPKAPGRNAVPKELVESIDTARVWTASTGEVMAGLSMSPGACESDTKLLRKMVEYGFVSVLQVHVDEDYVCWMYVATPLSALMHGVEYKVEEDV